MTQESPIGQSPLYTSRLPSPLITVSDVVTLALPPGSRVLGGQSGVSREVAWAIAMRTRAPIFPNIKGAEIAIVTVDGIRGLEPSVSLAEVIASLAEHQASGIVVLDRPDDDAIGEANRLGFPLISAPGVSSTSELEGTINRVIADRRTHLYERSLEIQQRLLDVAASGRGLSAIIGTLARLSGRTIGFLDSSLTLRALHDKLGNDIGGGTGDLIKHVQSAIRSRRSGLPAHDSLGTFDIMLAGAGQQALIAEIRPTPKLSGYLFILVEDVPTAEDWLAIMRGSSACALELRREWTVVEAESRARGDFLNDLLLPGYASDDQIATRARHIGFDLEAPHVAVAFGERDADLSAPSLVEIIDVIDAETSKRTPSSRFGQIGGIPLLLWPVGDSSSPETLQGLIERIHGSVAKRTGRRYLAGIGRVGRGTVGVRRSWMEAKEALRIGRRFYRDQPIISFDDLGPYRVLLQLVGNHEGEQYCQEVLGNLERYDVSHRSELINTLETYLKCNCSLMHAAELMMVHRNTLAYRLRRIEDLTGRDLDTFEDLFELELALKLRQAFEQQDA